MWYWAIAVGGWELAFWAAIAFIILEGFGIINLYGKRGELKRLLDRQKDKEEIKDTIRGEVDKIRGPYSPREPQVGDTDPHVKEPKMGGDR